MEGNSQDENDLNVNATDDSNNDDVTMNDSTTDTNTEKNNTSNDDDKNNNSNSNNTAKIMAPATSGSDKTSFLNNFLAKRNFAGNKNANNDDNGDNNNDDKGFSNLIKEGTIINYDNVQGKIDYATLVARSNSFNRDICNYPVKSNLSRQFKNENDKQLIERCANGTKPILCSKLKTLLDDFITLKKEHGTDEEKQVYNNISMLELVDRLIRKRPLMFMMRCDRFQLRDGMGGAGGWEKIGHGHSLKLTDYMSYDEIQISAMLCVSSPTIFINNGDRDNRGIKARSNNKHQLFGIYVGVVGARFERDNVMESQHILIDPSINTPANGYGHPSTHPEGCENTKKNEMWAKFYDQKDDDGTYFLPSFDDVKAYCESNPNNTKYYKKRSFFSSCYFNIEVYKKRMAMSISAFLSIANEEAKARNMKAYVHTVGYGLGVWMVDREQTEWIVETHADVIRSLSLPFISDLDFSWFNCKSSTCGNAANGEQLQCSNGNSITIHFSKRNPADKLSDPNKLLVAAYAWDGNSFPGNEYWAGMLTASGDPAAASCSLISELQNAYVNTALNANNIYWSPDPKL